MYESILLELGLTVNEIKVYLALLKIGKSQSGKIVKESRVSSGKIYESLHKLQKKGLIELTVENGIKRFMASNPESLLLYMNEKKNKIEEKTKELEKIIPSLKDLFSYNNIEEGVFLIKGFRGIKPIIYETLKDCKNEIKVQGIRSSKEMKYNIFWQHWHAERAKLKINAKVIFSDKGSNYWKFFKNLNFTKTRTITSISPSAIMVIENNVFIFSYEDDFTCVHIISPNIAKSFSGVFDSLWLISKE